MGDEDFKKQFRDMDYKNSKFPGSSIYIAENNFISNE